MQTRGLSGKGLWEIRASETKGLWFEKPPKTLFPDEPLAYSTYLGGNGGRDGGLDAANAIAVDTAGNAYVAGYTWSSDFPVTQGAFQTTNKATCTTNAFV